MRVRRYENSPSSILNSPSSILNSQSSILNYLRSARQLSLTLALPLNNQQHEQQQLLFIQFLSERSQGPFLLNLHRVHRDIQFLGNLFVACPVHVHKEHLALAWRQRVDHRQQSAVDLFGKELFLTLVGDELLGLNVAQHPFAVFLTDRIPVKDPKTTDTYDGTSSRPIAANPRLSVSLVPCCLQNVAQMYTFICKPRNNLTFFFSTKCLKEKTCPAQKALCRA